MSIKIHEITIPSPQVPPIESWDSSKVHSRRACAASRGEVAARKRANSNAAWPRWRQEAMATLQNLLVLSREMDGNVGMGLSSIITMDHSLIPY